MARASRPRRQAAAETREVLVETAARLFNQVGYEGTDSNAIARAAGYSPGTFYRHFEDKRAIFLAAHARWVRVEWEELRRRLARPSGSPDETAVHLVEWLVEHHRAWRRFRASLRALRATDDVVRRFVDDQRRDQLALVAALRARSGAAPRATEGSILLLLTMERTCDALAEGEVAALGGDEAAFIKLLEREIGRFLA